VVIAALLIVLLGLALLERMLEAAGNMILPPLAMATFLTGAILAVVAESSFFSTKEWPYALLVIFVVLAFLAQAAFGAALLQTGLVPGWAGWATVIWNLAWLVILPIARPNNIYYPWLHYVAPLLIGILPLTGG
jgi:hypothetical protein